MPVDAIPVPASEDRREPTTLPADSGQRLTNVRAWRGRIDKFGGLTQLGTEEVLANQPRTFFEGVFPDGTRRLIALASGMFQVWDGATWSSNLSGAAGRATIPAATNTRYSVVNTLGKVYIAAGGNNNLIVYDPTIAAPNDLVALTGHGVAGVTNLSCRVILAYGDRLVLVRTIEDNVDQPNRIRWNALTAGPVGGFDTTLTGAALREVIETSSEPLTGGFVIGERAFLTKAHEILELIPSENPDAVFAIESRIAGAGLIAPYSVAVAQNIAFFVGSDNIFAFDGTQLRAIGDPIIDAISDLFESRGNDQLRPIGLIYPRRGEYWLLPRLSGNDIFVYDYLNNRWYSQDMSVGVDNGPSSIGTVSASLTSSGLETQTVVMNGSTGRSLTAFILNEDVTSRVNYNSATDAFICTVRTRQMFPKRKGFRGVVEPAATDRVNVLWEVSFKGAASTTVTVTATDANGDTQSQTVTTDAGGRGKAFFNFPWQCVDFLFTTTNTSDFRLAAVISYRWSEGGIHLPTDPA